MSTTQASLPVTFPVLSVPTTIDYTSKDFTSMTQSVLAYAKTAFPQWNPVSEGDFGLMMVELFAYLGDILSYYGDRISQEAYLPTATQRGSLLNIATLLGYVPSNGTPASGTVTFQTANPGPPVTVPTGTQLAAVFSVTADTLPVFETTADVTVPGNGGTATGTVVQGETQTMVTVGVSDGTLGQEIQIPEPKVIDGSVTVYVQTAAGSEQWNQIAYLVDAGPADRVYQLSVDQNQVTSIIFGDSLNGLVPAAGMTVWATFRTGIGAAGNVASGSVQSFVSPVPGVGVQLLEDGVSWNSSAMTGGSDPESNDQIRVNAPAAYRSQQRAIAPQDYIDLALAVPGVLMANAVATHSTSVTLYCLGPNYQLPGPVLSDQILSYFDGKTAAGVTLSLSDPGVIAVDIGTTGNPVQLFVKDTYIQAAVVAAVTAALQALLSPPNVSFTQLLTAADVYTAIMGVAGVTYALVPVFTREDLAQTGTTPIQFRPTEVPKAGAINIAAVGGLTA